MPGQNFFLQNSKLFPKRAGLLLNTSQNFKGISIGTSLFEKARSIIPTIFILFNPNFDCIFKMTFRKKVRMGFSIVYFKIVY